MSQAWEPDRTAMLIRRLCSPPKSTGRGTCPDIWELDNGDIVVIGRDLTDHYATTLPADAKVGQEERLVVIPRLTFMSTKVDMPDA